MDAIQIFINELNTPLRFDIFKYDLTIEEDKKRMYLDWYAYYGKIAVPNYNTLLTSFKTKQLNFERESTKAKQEKERLNIGDEGEEYVFVMEKNRVKETHPRLSNKVLFLGKQRGLGYDISSVEAGENQQEPEFARFIEVKSTKRVTIPDLNDETWTDTINLTRKEWIAAKQYRSAYNVYRVYFTPHSVVVRKINDPYQKNECGIIQVLPTLYRMDFNAKSIDIQY